MNYVTPKDQEEINEVIATSGHAWTFSWANIARRTGWSVSTVRKYYDPNWYPGKYYQKPISITNIHHNTKPGIYLLAQQIVEDNQIINLIKIGKSKNIYERLNTYKGMNPFAKCIDILNCHEDELTELENLCHKYLGIKNRRYGGTEWFVCDDEEYQWWLKNKLKIFRSDR